MKYLSALIALVLLPLAALAQGVTALPPMTVITFNPGSNTSTMNGQMVPGGRDLYYVQAKAGQTMNVSVSSAAPIAFQVYNPDATVARSLGIERTPAFRQLWMERGPYACAST